MRTEERIDLYKLLNGLGAKLGNLAERTTDHDTADELYELVYVIDDSAEQLFLNREANHD